MSFSQKTKKFISFNENNEISPNSSQISLISSRLNAKSKFLSKNNSLISSDSTTLPMIKYQNKSMMTVKDSTLKSTKMSNFSFKLNNENKSFMLNVNKETPNKSLFNENSVKHQKTKSMFENQNIDRKTFYNGFYINKSNKNKNFVFNHLKSPPNLLLTDIKIKEKVKNKLLNINNNLNNEITKNFRKDKQKQLTIYSNSTFVRKNTAEIIEELNSFETNQTISQESIESNISSPKKEQLNNNFNIENIYTTRRKTNLEVEKMKNEIRSLRQSIFENKYEYLNALHNNVQKNHCRKSQQYKDLKEIFTQFKNQRIIKKRECEIFSRIYLQKSNALTKINSPITLPYVLQDANLIQQFNSLNMKKLKK